MSHPLEQRLAGLRRQVQRLLAIYGLSWVVCVAVGAVIVSCLLDRWLHLDAQVRLMLLMVTAGGLVWSAYRFLIRPLVVRFRDLDMALRIERRYPDLMDRLASTVQFIREPAGSTAVGSPALREAVIAQTLERTTTLEFDTIIETRPVRRAGLAAFSLLGLAVLITVLAPSTARIALARLIRPFGGPEWPKQVQLGRLQAPERVARGDRFKVSVAVVKGQLPARATIHYRFADGTTDRAPMRTEGARGFAGVWDGVTQAFDFTITAGDDTTPVRHVQVVPPPVVERIQLQMTYPAYTRQAAEDLPVGRGHVQALVGTTVRVRARSNKPLDPHGVVLHVTAPPRQIPAVVDDTGYGLEARFPVEQTGAYWIALTDTQGFKNREAARYEIRAIRDQKPDVVIKQPASDHEVVADATERIVATAQDDQALQEFWLAYTVRDDQAPAKQPAEQAVRFYPDPKAPRDQQDAMPRRLQADYRWDLAGLKLKPGMVVTLRAKARDFDNLTDPKQTGQVGESLPRSLRIITRNRFIESVNNRQFQFYQEIQRLLEMQEKANANVQDLTEQLRHTGKLGKPDVEKAQAAELTQQQIHHRVVNPSEGLKTQVAELRTSMRNNHFDDAETVQRIKTLESELTRLAADHLPQAHQELTSARKAAQDALSQGNPSDSPARDTEKGSTGAGRPRRTATAQPGPEPANRPRSRDGANPAEQPRPPAGQPQDGPKPAEKLAGAAAIARASAHQQEITADFRTLLDLLGKWQSVSGVTKAAQEVLKQQEAINQETRTVGRTTVGKPVDALTAQEKADLAKAADKQKENAAALARLDSQMSGVAEQLKDKDPAATAVLNEAREQLRGSRTPGQMGEAADRVSQNQVGSAVPQQQQITTDLHKLVDTLRNGRERELKRLLAKLKKTQKQLQEVARKHAGLMAKTRAAQKNPNPAERKKQLQELAKQQDQVQKQNQRLLAELKKIEDAAQAMQAASRAGSSMSKAGQQLARRNGGQAQKDQEEALDQLKQAQRHLARAIRDAEEQLAMEQLAKIQDDIKAMLDRQTRVIQTTARLEGLRANPAVGWKRSQLKDLVLLARNQAGLRDETHTLAERLTAAPVFRLALERAEGNMDKAATRLTDKTTDRETQECERAAARRFAQLLDALKPLPPKPGGGGGGGGGGGQPPPDGIPSAAQIKMLKALQLEINHRTEELAAVVRKGRSLSKDQRSELRSLSKDQGTLAGIVRDLTKPKGTEP